jgi:hypothetical protein
MAEPTLLEVFGAGATQTATELRISKADLTTVGLTASGTNTPESLLAAIIALAQLRLTELAFDANIDQSITITNGTDALISRNGKTYRQTNKTVEFYKVDNVGTFDPDDY